MAKTQMKIKHLWSLICERVVIDSTTNNLSLTNVLEEVQVVPSANIDLGSIPDFKTAIPVPLTFHLVSNFRKLTTSAYNGELRISIFDPENKELNSTKHIIKIDAQLKRFRGIIGFQGFKITSPGEYKFIIEIKESTDKVFKKMGEVPLEVKIAIPTA